MMDAWLDMDTLWERLVFASIEVAVFAAVVAGIARLAGHRVPRVIAIMWLLVLVKPLLTLCAGSPMPVIRLDLSPPEISEATLIDDIGRSSAFSSAGSINGLVHPRASALRFDKPAWRPDVQEFIVSLWLLGVCAAVWRIQADRKRVYRITHSGFRPTHVMRSVVSRLSQDLGVRHVPEVIMTDQLQTPAIVGFLSPVILVPRWIGGAEHARLIEWSLRHELMHWKLGDTFANGIRRIVSAAFFFHPAVWYAGRKWEEYAELACDRALIVNVEEGRDYAEALFSLLRAAHAPESRAARSGLFAVRTQIGKRIAALLSPRLSSETFADAWKHAAGVTVYRTDLELDESLDNSVYYIRAKGDFLVRNGILIGLTPGTTGRVEERRNGETRRFDIHGTGSDGFEFTVRLNGAEHEFDVDAQQWLNRTLTRFRTKSKVLDGLNQLQLEAPRYSSFEKGKIHDAVARIIADEVNSARIITSEADRQVAEKISERVADHLTEWINAQEAQEITGSSVGQIGEEIRKSIREAEIEIVIDPALRERVEEIVQRVSRSVSKTEW